MFPSTCFSILNIWTTLLSLLLIILPEEVNCFISLCSYEVLLTLDMEKHKIGGTIYYYLFNTLLFCLLILHIYWWKLMVVMLVNQIHARGRISDDVRSGKGHNLVDLLLAHRHLHNHLLWERRGVGEEL